MARLTREQQRLLVAEALRNLTKPEVLDSSELTQLLHVQPEGRGFWPRANGLSSRLTKAAQSVASKLEGVERWRMHRELLLAVLEGQTLAGFARSKGKSREWVSKRYWVPLTSLIVQELQGER